MKLILAIVPLMLFSCAAHKETYELCQDTIVIEDTIVIPGQHIHYPEESTCIYFEEMRFPFVDTIHIDYYVLKKK